MESSIDRFVRQQELVPQQRLQDLSVTVIGVGAVGRQVVLQLAAIGVSKLQLIDFDTVEPTNVTTQGYFADDVGRIKVEATADAARRIAPEMTIEVINDRYRSKYAVGDAVFCCVDSITARAAIWRSLAGHCRFWADARMLGEVIRVLTVDGHQGRTHYPSTLFAQSEAQTGRCTSQSTVYTANIAAGLLLHQFTRWLRRLPVARDITFDLLADDLVTC